MAERKMLSLREFKLLRLKQRLAGIIQEPVFTRKEIFSILEALSCSCKRKEKLIQSLKNGKTPCEFGIIGSDFNNNYFYSLNDLWKFLVELDQAGAINLSAAGLNTSQDLAAFEIPIYVRKPEPNVGFSPQCTEEEESDSLHIEGFWENGIRALEG